MAELLYESDFDRPPIFVSAGVIKTDEQIRAFAAIPDIAVQIIGSFSEPEWGGNDPTGTKTVFYWDQENQAAYNAIGLKNPGREAASKYLPDAVKRVHERGQLALISVTALEHEDPRQVLPMLAEWAVEMGADGVEVDGSCPSHGTILCQEPEATREVMELTRKRVGADPYLSIKLALLPQLIVDQYRKGGLMSVDGISLINAIRKASPIDPSTGEPRIEVNGGFAGQSGPRITSLARESLLAWNMNADGELNSNPNRYQLWSVGGLDIDGGREIHDRVTNLGAYMVGAAQAFRRTDNPRELARRWAADYYALLG